MDDKRMCSKCNKNEARFVFQRSAEVYDLRNQEYVEQLWDVEDEQHVCRGCAVERAAARFDRSHAETYLDRDDTEDMDEGDEVTSVE